MASSDRVQSSSAEAVAEPASKSISKVRCMQTRIVSRPMSLRNLSELDDLTTLRAGCGLHQLSRSTFPNVRWDVDLTVPNFTFRKT